MVVIVLTTIMVTIIFFLEINSDLIGIIQFVNWHMMSSIQIDRCSYRIVVAVDFKAALTTLICIDHTNKVLEFELPRSWNGQT